MDYKVNERKILIAFAIGLLAVAIAYYIGKALGSYDKKIHPNESSIELSK